MSCYFRHLKDVFNEAGIEVTPGNKKQIDQAIHQIVGTHYKECPVTWKKLKQDVMNDEQKRHDFIAALKNTVR